MVDFGDVGAGAASFWVPYVGNGTYTVSVSAYGTPPASRGRRGGRARLVRRRRARETATTGGPAETPGPDATGGAADGRGADGPGYRPRAEPEEPTCVTPEPEPEPPTRRSRACRGPPDDGATPISDDASATLDTSAELPESVECPGAIRRAGPATG